MSETYPIQQSFAGGEITPDLQGQTSSELYGKSLQLCENWTLKPQGSLRLRGGSKFRITAQSEKSRLFTFARLELEDIIVEVSEVGIFFYLRLEPFTAGTVANLMIDPTTLEGFVHWSWVSLAFGSQGPPAETVAGVGPKIYNATQNYTYMEVNQTFPVNVNTDLHSFTLNIFHTLNLNGAFGDDAVIYGDFFIEVMNPSNDAVLASYHKDFRPAGPDILNVLIPIQLDFTPTGLSSVKVRFRTNTDEDGGQTNIQFGDVITQMSSMLVVDQSPPVAALSFPPVWAADDIKDIQVAQDTALRSLYFVHPSLSPYVFKLDDANVATFDAAVLTGKPAAWVDGNWPSVVEIFQGRLWLAAAPLAPSTINASKVGNFQTWTVGSGADDPLAFTLITNGVIEWLRGNKVLIIGTDRSEWVGFGAAGPITPSDFQFERQSELGSLGIQPVTMGDQIAYVGLDKQRVRAMNFDGDSTNTWASEEISLQADNLVLGRVTDMAYARDPDYQLACIINETGQIAMCMHDRITGNNGWYRVITQGQILNLTASRDSIGTNFWAVVQRGADYNIEIFNPSDNVQAHLDSYVVGQVEETADQMGVGAFSDAFDGGFDGWGIDAKSVSGMEHFEGQTVQCVIADDLSGGKQHIHPDVHVFEGKAVLEGWATGYALVGYGYKAKAVTQRLEGTQRAGSSQGSKRHFSRIFARMIKDSSFPILNGYRPVPEAPDDDDPLNTTISGDVEIRAEGTLNQGVVIIEQDLPLSTEIAALFGKVTSKVT